MTGPNLIRDRPLTASVLSFWPQPGRRTCRYPAGVAARILHET